MNSLYSKTKIGIIWTALEKLFVQGIVFTINIILARLLTPNDYGVIGLLSIFLTFANVFIESGFSKALIQKQDRTEKDFSTTLIFNFFVSIVIYIILYASSPAIANYFGIQELVILQRVLFLVIILNSLIVVQSAKLQINIDFKKIAYIQFFSTVVSGILAIFFAYKGFGVWSLVILNISKNLFLAIFYWFFGKWIPSTFFSFTSFKELFSFGSKLLLSGLLSTSVSNLTNLLIGKVYRPDQLGYYTRAKQFPDIISGILSSSMNTATFPLMASLQNDNDNMLITFKRLIKISGLLIFPLMAGLAVLSEEIILVALSEKWLLAADYLFWISLSYCFTPLSILNMSLLNAIGRSDLFLKVDLSKIPIILILIAITFPISLKAVVIGDFLGSFVYFSINTFITKKKYDFGPIKQIAPLWKGIIGTLIMSMSIYFLKSIIIINLTIKLLILIFFGMVIYYLILKLLKEQELVMIEKKIFLYIKGK